MIKRVITGIVALALAGLAVGVPIVLTEAGNSRSTTSGEVLNAAFSLTTGDGDYYYAYMWASEGTSTFQSGGGGNQGGGGGSERAHGGGGSNRAKSTRQGGNDNSSEFRYIQLYIDHYDSQFNLVEYWDVYGDLDSLVIANDLSSGSVSALLQADVYDEEFNHLRTTTVQVDLDFIATGPLVTSRDRFVDHIKSPRQRITFMTTESRRNAEATGLIVADGLNIAGNGSEYAQIATFSDKSSFQN